MRTITIRSMQRLRVTLIALLLSYVSAAGAHWPDQPPHQLAYLGDFSLERGGVIENIKISYVTHGKLNAAKDNAVLFIHALGMNHHQADHLIGPRRPFDTEKYFVICPDLLREAPHCALDRSSSHAGVPVAQERGQDGCLSYRRVLLDGGAKSCGNVS